MPYLQSPFRIIQQASLFPFYRCLNWGMERFVHVLNVAYRVSSGDGIGTPVPWPHFVLFLCFPRDSTFCAVVVAGAHGKMTWVFSALKVPSALWICQRSNTLQHTPHSKAVPQGYVPSPRTHIGCQGTKEVTQERDFYNIWNDLLKDPETLSGCTGLAGS